MRLLFIGQGNKKLRIGFGYCKTAFIEKKTLTLCGTNIPFDKGLEEFNKIDIITYAISDALLGAAGLGDVNDYFGEIEKSLKVFDSLNFLKEIERILNFEKFKISNIDVSLSPNLQNIKNFKSQLISNIAESLFLKPNQINIKISSLQIKKFDDYHSVACYSIALLQAK